MHRSGFLSALSQIPWPRCNFPQNSRLISGNFLVNFFAICDPRDAIFVHFRCKATNSHLDHSKVPKLEEDDLEEQFVRGSGPGGQATNKTNNAVVLRHKPTGIVVKCHETRSLWDNKKRAREILTRRLDNLINGSESLESQERALMSKKSARKSQKREKMLALKAAFKEREGIE